jgi:hypothetical protein
MDPHAREAVGGDRYTRDNNTLLLAEDNLTVQLDTATA